MPDAPPLVSLRGLTRRYGAGSALRSVLDGVDLDVERGELVALLGRSGSGKSTLLNLVAGIDVPDAGTVHVDGRDLAAMDEGARTRFRRRHVGMVFQAFHLVPVLTVAENVALPLELDGRPDADGRRRIAQLLEAVGLADRADERPDVLSGGEQQRIAVARALVRRPSLVLADEPTGNLDDDNAELVLELLTSMARAENAAVLLATHSARCAAACDRVLRVAHGALVAETAAG